MSLNPDSLSLVSAESGEAPLDDRQSRVPLSKTALGEPSILPTLPTAVSHDKYTFPALGFEGEMPDI